MLEDAWSSRWWVTRHFLRSWWRETQQPASKRPGFWICWMGCEVLPYFTASFRAQRADETRDKLRQMPWWNHIAGSLQSGTPFLALLRKKPRKLIESHWKLMPPCPTWCFETLLAKNKSLRSRCSKPMILVMLAISALPKSPRANECSREDHVKECSMIFHDTSALGHGLIVWANVASRTLGSDLCLLMLQFQFDQHGKTNLVFRSKSYSIVSCAAIRRENRGAGKVPEHDSFFDIFQHIAKVNRQDGQFCGEVSKYLESRHRLFSPGECCLRSDHYHGVVPLRHGRLCVCDMVVGVCAWWAIDAIGSHTCFHTRTVQSLRHTFVLSMSSSPIPPAPFPSSWPWWIITVISLSLLLVRILVRLLLLLPLLPHWSYHCVLMPGKLSHSWSELSWLKRGDFVPVSCNLYNFLATWIV